jgi:hypothetical protein
MALEHIQTSADDAIGLVFQPSQSSHGKLICQKAQYEMLEKKVVEIFTRVGGGVVFIQNSTDSASILNYSVCQNVAEEDVSTKERFSAFRTTLFDGHTADGNFKIVSCRSHLPTE